MTLRVFCEAILLRAIFEPFRRAHSRCHPERIVCSRTLRTGHPADPCFPEPNSCSALSSSTTRESWVTPKEYTCVPVSNSVSKFGAIALDDGSARRISNVRARPISPARFCVDICSQLCDFDLSNLRKPWHDHCFREYGKCGRFIRCRFQGPPKTGTTIVACVYDGGVVLGADTRVSTGICVSNRASDKMTVLEDTTVMCRSGSAADTEAIASFVRYHVEQIGDGEKWSS